jgi:hypothetical protein
MLSEGRGEVNEGARRERRDDAVLIAFLQNDRSTVFHHRGFRARRAVTDAEIPHPAPSRRPGRRLRGPP